MRKKALLILGVNIFLVALTLLLSYRMLAPQYEQKATVALDTLGAFHTGLAAERLTTRLGMLRDELKENSLRLVDTTRGPIFLDPARWLWMRVQDRDWRAPNYLDPLPKPRTDVDTWNVSAAKNSLVIAQRIPIVKEGVQDFVLIEGGAKLAVMNDLQNDPRFGLWIFDLNAYKKGGLGAGKVYERMSAAGPLTKEDMGLMTSDFVSKLFTANDTVPLDTNQPWEFSFKKTPGNEQLAVVGFWVREIPSPGFTPLWFGLLAALLVITGLATFLSLRLLGRPEGFVRESANEPSAPNDGGPQSPKLPTPIGVTSPAPHAIGKEREQDVQRFIRGLCLQLQGSLSDRGEAFVSRVLAFLDKKDAKFENIDLEIAYHEFAKDSTFLKSIESFFDLDIWRIFTDVADLKMILTVYLEFLAKHAALHQLPRFSARFCKTDSVDSGCVELRTSIYFKDPYNRLTFHVAAKEPLGRTHVLEAFQLSADSTKFDNIELPLSLEVVERLHGRLRMKSNFEDGHVIYFDIPGAEARRPEDIVYVKQLRDLARGKPATAAAPPSLAMDTLSDDSSSHPKFSGTDKTVLPIAETHANSKVLPINEGNTNSEPLGFESELIEDQEGEPATEAAPKTKRLAELEKVSNFAENISDERSRVRSRFRIRRPGEKE